jgi:hypothetical protein
MRNDKALHRKKAAYESFASLRLETVSLEGRRASLLNT